MIGLELVVVVVVITLGGTTALLLVVFPETTGRLVILLVAAALLAGLLFEAATAFNERSTTGAGVVGVLVHATMNNGAKSAAIADLNGLVNALVVVIIGSRRVTQYRLMQK